MDVDPVEFLEFLVKDGWIPRGSFDEERIMIRWSQHSVQQRWDREGTMGQ